MTRPSNGPVTHADQLRATLLARRPDLAGTPDLLDDIVATSADVARDRLSGLLSTTQVRPDDVDDCHFLSADMRRMLLDLAMAGRSPATTTRTPHGAADPQASWTRQPRSRTGLTLSTVIAKLSGLHFAKEALTAGEREILTLAEALADELHALHGGYARTLLSPTEASAAAAAVHDVLIRRPK